jgi:hypothetical protein
MPASIFSSGNLTDIKQHRCPKISIQASEGVERRRNAFPIEKLANDEDSSMFNLRQQLSGLPDLARVLLEKLASSALICGFAGSRHKLERDPIAFARLGTGRTEEAEGAIRLQRCCSNLLSRRGRIEALRIARGPPVATLPRRTTKSELTSSTLPRAANRWLPLHIDHRPIGLMRGHRKRAVPLRDNGELRMSQAECQDAD